MKNKKIFLPAVAFIMATGAALTSCSVENPLDNEQYVKKIYLIGAYDQMQTKEVSYNDGELYVAVGIGGSLFSSSDVSVTLGLAAQENIDNYNYKNVVAGDIEYQSLPESWYSMDWTGTIKAGEAYGRIPIKVDASKIECDSLYVIPLEIKSVSQYEKVTEDTTLLVSIKMVNDYSGSSTWVGSTIRYENGVPVYSSTSSYNTPRTLTAVDANTVRLFQRSQIERYSNLASDAYTITVNSDNTLTIKAWKDMPITDGGGTYEPDKKVFNIWYTTLENGHEYRTEATITHS